MAMAAELLHSDALDRLDHSIEITTKRKKSTSKKDDQVSLSIIEGTVIKRKFHNPENGYTVLKVRLNDLSGVIDVIGNMPSVREGDQYKFTGTELHHPQWGKQFKFISSEIILPTGTVGVARHLSGITAGVGLVKAQKIVDSLGENCLQKIKDFPEVLDTLDFLDDRQRREIAEDLSKNSVQAELAGLIRKEGIGPAMVAKIYNKYGADSVKVVKENPYILADDLYGVGFITADGIAQTVGIAPNSPYRVESALNYTLEEAGNQGHVYLEPNTIVGALLGKRDQRGKSIAKGIIEGSGVTVSQIAEANRKLILSDRCVREGDAVYAKHLYIAECTVAKAIIRLLNNRIPSLPNLDAMISDIENRDGLSYAPEQKEAIKTSLQNRLSIITGGPGVGKTTVINAICDIYKKLYPHNYLYLAAPTGRAAKRMREATEKHASTIHRLLCYNPRSGGFEFGPGNPLSGPGLAIIDESSMIDIELMADLISAVDDLQVIFVGDVDQLPSVGPGSVLRDMIASGCVPTTRLKFNFRQAGGSKIAAFANMVCDGVSPPLQNDGDFEFFKITELNQAPNAVTRYVVELIENGYGKMDFQILSPMKKNSCGTNNLNYIVREIVNPLTPEKPTIESFHLNDKNKMESFRLGDKVMVIKNNYTLGVFNGDLGEITAINKGITTVDFGNDIVDFKVSDLDLLTLAYASTIHKSQGSEFPIVIMVLTTQHFIMWQRNLLYTGMTRAKHRLVIIASDESVKESIRNNKIEKRFSMLAQRIRDGRRDLEMCENNGVAEEVGAVANEQEITQPQNDENNNGNLPEDQE
jgi:exodeoxyribonuclease V alpha subunit